MSAHDTLRHQLDASLAAEDAKLPAMGDAQALLAEIRRIDDFHGRTTADGIVVHYIRAAILRAEARGMTEGHALMGAAFDRVADAAA